MLLKQFFIFIFILNFFVYLFNSEILFLNNIYFDFFGIVMIFSSIVTVLMCLYLLNNKFEKKYVIKNLFFFIFFFLFFLFSTNNLLLFFIFYELLLVPSVFLAMFSSPNIRSRNISFYFLFWTQLGSFLVLLVCVYVYVTTGSVFFQNLNDQIFSFFFKFLLFVGFGIKIPIWPFHFWLTKTHVEVNTSFSIFLSGILVKTALYGLYKFGSVMLELNYFFIFLSFVGLVDASLKIAYQTDMKRVVATCTVFEMNIILLNFLFLSISSHVFTIYFCILHTFLSFLFFYLTDCIYRRSGTRSFQSIGNFINTYPVLSLFLITCLLLFNGIPFTLKFYLEIIFFLKILNLNILFFLIFTLIQIFFIIFFSKLFLLTLFTDKKSLIFFDLKKYEFNIFLFTIMCFLFFSFF